MNGSRPAAGHVGSIQAGEDDMATASSAQTVELLARGVCRHRGQLLLCRNRHTGNAYLPGGHIEGEERAPDALRREIREELGLTATVGRFLGVVQHAFDQHGRRVVEIDQVFVLRLPNPRLSRPPASREAKLEFVWEPLTDLPQSGLQPRALARLLPAWLKPAFRGSRWASTF